MWVRLPFVLFWSLSLLFLILHMPSDIFCTNVLLALFAAFIQTILADDQQARLSSKRLVMLTFKCNVKNALISCTI